MKLSEQILNDLSDTAVKRSDRLLRDALQLVDDTQQRFVIATFVCAHTFGVAARLFQFLCRENGKGEPDFAECAEAVTKYVLDMAKETPAGPLPSANESQANCT